MFAVLLKFLLLGKLVVEDPQKQTIEVRRAARPRFVLKIESVLTIGICVADVCDIFVLVVKRLLESIGAGGGRRYKDTNVAPK